MSPEQINAAAEADQPVALYVITDLPFPPRSGNHLRYLQIARALELLGWSVRIVACAVRPDAAEASVGPAGTLSAVISPQAPTTRPLERAARAARIAAMIARRAESDPFAAAYVRAGIEETVAEVVDRVRPDAIVLRSLFAHLAPTLRTPRRPVVLDVHDATPLMTRLLSASAPALQRIGLAARYRIARRTDRLMARADELWVPSTREVTYFAERAPRVPTILVPNGIDIADDAGPREPRSDRDLVLIGNFGWPANLHAADTLVEVVLPAVRKHVPQARVVLVGRDLPADRSSRWTQHAVDWRGVVPDIGPVLDGAAAFVFAPPAWAISAMPLKVAEALARGTLLAASPSALGGFPLRNGVEALVLEDATALGDALGKALSLPGRSAEISEAGRRWARATLSVESVVERLRRESLLGAAGRR